MSSNCTGTLVCEIGNVAPSANTRDERPKLNCTYFNPNNERDATDAVESTGTRPSAVFNRNVNCAPDCPSANRIGLISDTIPTRRPPSITSLPGTNAAPFARSTFNSRVGTNGNPPFALYAKNTATIATNTVTAPIRTGFANA